MEIIKEQIADLYYRSNSVNFGQYRMSVHQDNPDLPLSPYYLHYPSIDKPGAELLGQLYELIGQEFYHILESQSPAIRPMYIAGVPNGALPLADAHARQYEAYPNNLLTFRKIEKSGKTIFLPPEEEFTKDKEVVIDDDHISGGRNKLLIIEAAKIGGLVTSTVLTVIDRQQGGVENMAKHGVNLLSILKISELLDFGLDQGYISNQEFETVTEYIHSNQF